MHQPFNLILVLRDRAFFFRTCRFGYQFEAQNNLLSHFVLGRATNMAASGSPSTTDQSAVIAGQTEETTSSSEISNIEEKYSQNDGDLASITAPDATSAQEDQGRLKGFRLVIVVTSVLLALFCVALDNTSRLGLDSYPLGD